MRKFFLIVTLSLFWNNASTAAALTLKDYNLLKNSDVMDLYIEGLLQGSKWTNALTKKNNEDNKNLKRAYCPPTNMVLELANAKTIINRSIEDLSKIYTKEELETAPIIQVLLIGLERTFPCE